MTLELRFRAMGCPIFVALDSANPEAEAELELVPIWFENWEQLLSRFRADSELSRLNAARQPMHVSPNFWRVLQAAQTAYQQSSGLVNPMILPALEAAGYDRSIEFVQQGEWSQTVSLEFERVAAFEEVLLDEEQRTVTLPSDSRLDLGGVAKGWAAQEAMQRLAQLGSVLVDASGDIAINGAPHATVGWRIGVADPFGEAEHCLVIEVAQGGVATSGRDRRQWAQNGEPQHHLIDPRTQAPSQTDVLSATVIADDLLRAEMASKTALLLGSQEGMEWLEQHEDLEGLLILEDGSQLTSKHFKEFIVEQSCLI